MSSHIISMHINLVSKLYASNLYAYWAFQSTSMGMLVNIVKDLLGPGYRGEGGIGRGFKFECKCLCKLGGVGAFLVLPNI